MIRFKQELINLEKNSSLDIRLNLEKPELVFGRDMIPVKPDIRALSQMQEVLLDKKASGPGELYYMYRGVGYQPDSAKIAKHHLSYDITIIRPALVGKEFVKTAGHYHLNSYPELYEVLWGEAFCLLQRPDKDDFTKIEDVMLVKVKAKEKIVIPPYYGHILINPLSEAPLVVANWVSSESSSDYTLYRKAKGAAYFIVNNDGEINLIKNDFFKELPEARTARPVLPLKQFGLFFDKPIYSILDECVEKLDFLKYPDKYDYNNCFVADKTLLCAVV
ncbi:MAG: glucose-6-phosphate isomerase family protein [Candidatus Omnitrophota bacterium]|nr:glucose-6-phosphate isomerase family protein [Candidatus Omnitrophota bacterium]